MKFYTTEQIGLTRGLTPEGYLVCHGVAIARTGVMLYAAGEVPVTPADGLVRIERDPEEVFADATIASFEGKPLCIDHPPVDVTPENWRQYAAGIVQNVRRGTGIDDDLLVGDILVTDAAAIKAIQDGTAELSAGYDADYQEIEPGRGRQTNIIANHVALVEKGRCGSRCAIGDSMKKLKFVDRLRAAFKARDEKAFEEVVKDAESEETEEEKKKGEEAEEEKKKTSDALTKLVSSLDALTSRVAALETRDSKSKDEDETEEEKQKREEEEAKKSEDKKARDTASLVEEVRDSVARAEILAPGLHLPTVDAAADPQKTRDAVCGLKRKALAKAFEGKFKDAVAPFVGQNPDFQKLTCDAVAQAFLGASEVVRQTNNATQTKGTFDGTKAAAGMAKSIADINAKNSAFWSRS
jgi:hypothetical protein